LLKKRKKSYIKSGDYNNVTSILFVAETCHSRGQPAEVGEKSNTMAINSPIQLQSSIAFRSSSAGK